MDVIRYCYETDARWYATSPMGRIRWFFAAEGAPWYPGPNVFYDKAYVPHPYAQKKKAGQSQYSKRDYISPLTATSWGLSVIGDPADFAGDGTDPLQGITCYWPVLALEPICQPQFAYGPDVLVEVDLEPTIRLLTTYACVGLCPSVDLTQYQNVELDLEPICQPQFAFGAPVFVDVDLIPISAPIFWPTIPVNVDVDLEPICEPVGPIEWLPGCGPCDYVPPTWKVKFNVTDDNCSLCDEVFNVWIYMAYTFDCFWSYHTTEFCTNTPGHNNFIELDYDAPRDRFVLRVLTDHNMIDEAIEALYECPVSEWDCTGPITSAVKYSIA